MAKFPDSPVLVYGRVAQVDDVYDFESKALKAKDVLVLGAETGAAVVRFPIGEFPRTGLEQLSPIAVLASPSAWAPQQGSANVRYTYRAPATAETIAAVAEAAGVA